MVQSQREGLQIKYDSNLPHLEQIYYRPFISDSGVGGGGE